ncbi:CGNR zinc finger domain-containing protein [Rhodococcus fascians]|nr:CGNR zinc finger domain-containing protein [Rhodococcus fascians]MBY4238870.1 CGNR zinc finger domain-containing protein [Rhodococcus fascians]MBY4255389.1 CGNR zinc finger domain-containing protein [Rhodococcus fascians]MBY4270225.1 CGNR zinc finger domain-containing protein [Rhodococcus fascians]
MLFAHDAELSLLSAVALVNSAEDPDTLTTRDELAEFFTDQGYSGRFDGDDAELEAVRAMRPTLRSLLTSSRDDAVIEVNRMLAESSALPRLVRHDTLDWHVHAVADDSPLATRIVVETAMAMIDVIRADELSRFDVCADPDCNGLVLDLSRNRSRRFCSTTCGNRAAVAAYRARKAQ